MIVLYEILDAQQGVKMNTLYSRIHANCHEIVQNV